MVFHYVVTLRIRFNLRFELLICTVVTADLFANFVTNKVRFYYLPVQSCLKILSGNSFLFSRKLIKLFVCFDNSKRFCFEFFRCIFFTFVNGFILRIDEEALFIHSF